jgi:hypothetical protein
MSYQYFNPNPDNKNVGDCTVRALCVATNSDWDSVFVKLSLRAFIMRDMPITPEITPAIVEDIVDMIKKSTASR